MNQILHRIEDKLLSNDFRYIELNVDDFNDNLFIKIMQKKGFSFTLDSQGELIREVKMLSKKNEIDFSNRFGFFDFHTDSLSENIIPNFISLFCVNPGNNNIPTTLVDSVKLANSVLNDEKTYILKYYDGVYIDKKGRTHSFPLINRNKNIDYCSIGSRCYLKPNIDKLDISQIPSLREFNNIIKLFFKKVDENIILNKKWKKNDLLVFNNLYCLHARLSNKGDEKRHLHRHIFNN